jgi:adenine phosphoribosyltransferase
MPAGPPPMIGTLGGSDIVNRSASPDSCALAGEPAAIPDQARGEAAAADRHGRCAPPHGSPEWALPQVVQPVPGEKRMVSIQFEHDLKDSIRTIPDYPKPGIMFRDITTLLGNARAFRRAVDELVQPWAGMKIDKVAGIEARGFILGGAVAHQVSAGFVPIRKKGKLPHKRVSIAYSLEYGLDEMEMHEDAVANGDRVILVDDLIATGGTAEGAVKLLRQLGAEVLAACFIIDLPDLGGAAKLRKLEVPVRTLITFEGH